MNKKIRQKNAFYSCEFCKFNTDNKTDYNRHILTPKHSNNNILISNSNENIEKTPKTEIFKCYCGKEYKYQSGLCAHKKKCSNYNDTNNSNKNMNNKFI